MPLSGKLKVIVPSFCPQFGFVEVIVGTDGSSFMVTFVVKVAEHDPTVTVKVKIPLWAAVALPIV